MNKRMWNKFVNFVIFAVAIALVIAIGVLIVQKIEQSSRPAESAVRFIKVDDALRDKLKSLKELPASEPFEVAEVYDLSQLSSELFYKDAQKGDKVLIYDGAKKQYLYRESTNSIIAETELK